MAALGRQFEQLQMFMPANQIRQRFETLANDREYVHVPGHDAHGSFRPETNDETWGRKYSEGATVKKGTRGRPDASHHDVMRSAGIEHPVPLGDGELLGGHHRVAWAATERPSTEVPVVHVAGEGGRWRPGVLDAQKQMKPFGGYR